MITKVSPLCHQGDILALKVTLKISVRYSFQIVLQSDFFINYFFLLRHFFLSIWIFTVNIFYLFLSHLHLRQNVTLTTGDLRILERITSTAYAKTFFFFTFFYSLCWSLWMLAVLEKVTCWVVDLYFRKLL